jgi:hypothetical protein
MGEMRKGRPDELPLMFFAFDLLHQDGVDLRASTALRAEAGPA